MRFKLLSVFFSLSLFLQYGCDQPQLVISGDFLREFLKDSSEWIDKDDLKESTKEEYNLERHQTLTWINNLQNQAFLLEKNDSLFTSHREFMGPYITQHNKISALVTTRFGSSSAEDVFNAIRLLNSKLKLSLYYSFLSAQGSFICINPANKEIEKNCSNFEQKRPVITSDLSKLHLFTYIDNLITWMKDLEKHELLIEKRNLPSIIIHALSNLDTEVKYELLKAPDYPIVSDELPVIQNPIKRLELIRNKFSDWKSDKRGEIVTSLQDKATRSTVSKDTRERIATSLEESKLRMIAYLVLRNSILQTALASKQAASSSDYNNALQLISYKLLSSITLAQMCELRKLWASELYENSATREFLELDKASAQEVSQFKQLLADDRDYSFEDEYKELSKVLQNHRHTMQKLGILLEQIQTLNFTLKLINSKTAEILDKGYKQHEVLKFIPKEFTQVVKHRLLSEIPRSCSIHLQ